MFFSSRTTLVLSLMLGLLLVPDTLGAMRLRQSGESGNSSAVAVVPHPISTVAALQTVLYPALQAIVAAPLRFFNELMREMRNYLNEHHMRDMFNMSMLHELFSRLPARISTYWTTFAEMEYECIRRTLCDVADVTSTRIPPWANQIVLIYFNTFGNNEPLYQAVTSGLITHNCQLLFHECDAKAFLERFSANVSRSMQTTAGPIRDAIHDLAAVTVSTIKNLAAEKSNELEEEEEDRRQPLELEEDRHQLEDGRDRHQSNRDEFEQDPSSMNQFRPDGDRFHSKDVERRPMMPQPNSGRFPDTHFRMAQFRPQHGRISNEALRMMQPPLPLRNLVDNR